MNESKKKKESVAAGLILLAIFFFLSIYLFIACFLHDPSTADAPLNMKEFSLKFTWDHETETSKLTKSVLGQLRLRDTLSMNCVLVQFS